jgi:hypothetical protein
MEWLEFCGFSNETKQYLLNFQRERAHKRRAQASRAPVETSQTRVAELVRLLERYLSPDASQPSPRETRAVLERWAART